VTEQQCMPHGPIPACLWGVPPFEYLWCHVTRAHGDSDSYRIPGWSLFYSEHVRTECSHASYCYQGRFFDFANKCSKI